MNLITVRCHKCKVTGYEHAFSFEHLDDNTRRCPQPKYDWATKKWDTCGGKLSIVRKYEGNSPWTKVRRYL